MDRAQRPQESGKYAMKRFLHLQIHEIQHALALRVLGSGLALTHLCTYIFWFITSTFGMAKTATSEPICWPFIPHCADLNLFSPTGYQLYGLLYAGLALLAAATFLVPKAVPVAYGTLALLTVMKLYVFWLDYHLMGNYHYMPFLLTFVLMFVSEKTFTVRWLLFAFYFSAGLLKLNSEWLSGAALPDQWIRPGTPPFWLREHGFLPLCCAYAFLLETVVGFALLSKKHWLNGAAFAQFIAFHIFSFWIVGWFYPAVMFSVLAFYPAYWFSAQPQARRWEWKTSSTVFLALFALAQAVPWMIPGDSSVTGQGRMFALNMFDSLTMCYSKSLARFDGYNVDVSLSPNEVGTGVRIRCDPYVYFRRAKDLCAALREEPGFSGLSLSLVSKRTSDMEFKEIVSVSDMCQEQISYSSLWPNPWINP